MTTEDLPSVEKLRRYNEDIRKLREVGLELMRLGAILANGLQDLEDFINMLIKLQGGIKK